MEKYLEKYRGMGFKPYVVKKNVEGVDFDFFIGDVSGRDWYDVQSADPEWKEMTFIREHLIKQGDVVFECGAHHGFTTVLFANWAGNTGKVIAFEPVPKNFDILKKNIELNKLDNVIPERKVVGAKEGKTKISGTSNSSVIRKGGMAVDMVPLDKYTHLRPTFLKIDTEGFEIEVLRGSTKILTTLPKLAIEIHTEAMTQFNSTVEDLFNLIDIHRYDLWVQWKDEDVPIAYDLKTPITHRVHLFAHPK
jgi:FkbM family methyltransferase